jgi:hypothetical protein
MMLNEIKSVLEIGPETFQKKVKKIKVANFIACYLFVWGAKKKMMSVKQYL